MPLQYTFVSNIWFKQAKKLQGKAANTVENLYTIEFSGLVDSVVSHLDTIVTRNLRKEAFPSLQNPIVGSTVIPSSKLAFPRIFKRKILLKFVSTQVNHYIEHPSISQHCSNPKHSLGTTLREKKRKDSNFAEDLSIINSCFK